MDFLTFRERMYPMGCFNINQVLLWEKDFDRNNLTRWCRKGLLVKLRNQHYAFPEYRQVPDFSRYVANRMYAPSYISLHSALSFYGMIPEEVVQLTSVTTLKTAKFENPFGTFHYQNVKTPLFFGYEIKMMQNGRGLMFATPEKALLDLLYLNPFYKTEQDMEELRLDEDFMQSEFNTERLGVFLSRVGNKALEKRIKCLIKVYKL
jgi:predicted transcriptional regulator of viral defense system